VWGVPGGGGGGTGWGGGFMGARVGWVLGAGWFLGGGMGFIRGVVGGGGAWLCCGFFSGVGGGGWGVGLGGGDGGGPGGGWGCGVGDKPKNLHSKPTLLDLSRRNRPAFRNFHR